MNGTNNLDKITDFDTYLIELNKIKKNVMILLSVKDTVGLHFRQESAELLNKIGIATNLSGKHGHSYIGLINKGKVVVDTLSSTNEDLNIRLDCNDKEIILYSSVYTRNNLSDIRIEDINYSIDLRGLNIVVYDISLDNVVDMVCFDTHVRSNICYRRKEKSEVQSVINERNIERLQRQLSNLQKNFDKLNNIISTESGKLQLMLWHSMCANGESQTDNKKRFFRAMPAATGDFRKLQQAGVILLKVFDDICRKNNIEYWITGGTLLGAIRHGGFIPWDDDADVCMMRSEIPKLKKALEGNDEFFLDEFCSVRHTEPAAMNHNYQVHFNIKNTPYSLDIFVCDFSENFDQTFVKKLREFKNAMGRESLELSRKMHGNKDVPNKRYDKEFLDLFWDHYEKSKVLYGNESKENYVIWALDNVQSTQGYKVFFPKDTIFPLKELQFEGGLYLAPNDPESYIEQMFGDYYSVPDDMLHKHFNMTEDRIIVLRDVIKKYEYLL